MALVTGISPSVVESRPGVTWLCDVGSPKAFSACLPLEYQPPTNKNPSAGLPKNVWCGVTIESASRTELLRVGDLIDVRARIRWVYLDGRFDSFDAGRLMPLLSSWRCTHCGRRGLAPRPALCPHAKALCGDAKLEPQIHWLLGRDLHRFEEARELGLVLWPNVPEVTS